MADRATRETDDPHLWCMPMGVPRSTPYPFRFVQNYTHKAPTHMFILHEGNIHSFRQIFMDGRKHPAGARPDLVRSLHRMVRQQGHARHRHGRVQRQVLVRSAGHAAHRAAAHDRAVDAGQRGHAPQRGDDRRSGRVLAAVRHHVDGAAGRLRATRSWNTSARRTTSTASPAATRTPSTSSAPTEEPDPVRLLAHPSSTRLYPLWTGRHAGLAQVYTLRRNSTLAEGVGRCPTGRKWSSF